MLDGGPSRVPQPVDRRPAHRPEVPRRYADDQKNHESTSKPTSGPDASPARSRAIPATKSPKRFGKWLAAGAAVVLIVALAWLAWTGMRGGAAVSIDRGKNQAVFLASGQIYFGKLEIIDDNYLKLSGVFYIQSSGSSSDKENSEEQVSPDMQLIKLGEEVHGPEDAMVINRDQVLYFENLKDDSQVSKLIKEYKSSSK